MANLNFQGPISDGDPLKQPVSPWSCFPCRRRKIRCDRRYPCSHCSKGNLACGFPVSGRTPTRRHDLPSFTSKTEKQDDLLGRLRRLEGFVAKLGSELQGGNQDSEDSLHGSSQALNLEMPSSSRSQSGIGGKHSQTILAELAQVTDELGTLVIHNNESVYVGNWLCGVISDEVKHIRQAIEDNVIESNPLEKRMLSPSIPGVPFFWGPTGLIHENLRPLPSQVFYIWETFVENVDPFIKVLHVPTMRKTIKEAKGKFNLMDRGTEALMFAISLAAVTSLNGDEVEENFGDDRKTLLARLRLGTEQALSRAGVMNTTDISTVQAFVIYQEIIKQNDGQRATWTSAGLLIRIALGMGLHRDGSHFPNVSPFDAEIRRRVWYHICLLDSRVGDCQVANVGITENLFDTKQPSNVNDTDITPDMTALPVSSEGYTGSTFCVLRCRLWRLACKFRSSFSIEPSSDDASTTYQLGLLTESRKCMAKDLKQYLKPRESPFHLLIQTMIVLELSKFDHIIHVANNFKSPHERDESHKAFALAVTTLQHAFQLSEQPSSAQWNWYLYSCIQWHTMSTLLVHLSTSPWGPVAEMAWGLAKKAFVHLSEGMSRDPMRQPLQDLMNSVAKHRELQIQKVKSNPTWAERLARIWTLQLPVPAIRDFSDGGGAFDTSVTEECLALEIDASATQPERFDVASSSSGQNFGVSERRDIWADLTTSFIGIDESDDFFQVPQNIGTHDHQAANENLEQHPGLTSIHNEHNGVLHNQEPWDAHTVSENEMGWLAWDSIFRTDGVP
ncbi:hypothetical protein F5Y12DRAFT_306523 [Xylaria sp. FL1777]|nr:hypothetical protein F5Y12DRAFT_306523 [Xylaria sp. FL1777]